jgi:hypothetical protein
MTWMPIIGNVRTRARSQVHNDPALLIQPEITDDERRILRENFTSSWLLDAVKEVDTLRDFFNGREGSRPLKIRETLLRLHELELEVVNRGHESRVHEFFNLAAYLDDELFEAAASLERIQRILAKLANFYPESLLNEEARASA